MKIELLKNKHTKIIEKIMINKGSEHKWMTIPFNLTHEQTMIELDKNDLKWHEIFIKFNVLTNIIEIKNKLFKEFNKREFNYLFDLLKNIHQEKFKDLSNGQSLDAWFVNYYVWTIFYLIKSTMQKNKIEKTASRIVDPAILFFVEGNNYVERFDIFYNNEKAVKLLQTLWEFGLETEKELIHNKLKELDYNNQDINLLIFKKELISLLPENERDYYFWNLKKKIISKVLIDLIAEKIHYM